MKPITLSLEQVRRLALNAQLLDEEADLPPGKEGVAQTIERLGYVQIDTIAVIERAHHHTLWARRPDYDPQMLDTLQAQERRVFEYWGHAASFLPMSDYRYYLPRKQGYYAPPTNKWQRARLEQCQHLLEPVLERIRAEGPLGSKDFKPPPGQTRGSWWDWKPAKVALELLFWRGELMITARRNFQRLYDLTERVLPSGVDTRTPDDDELGAFLVRRALSAHGVARERTIQRHIHAAGHDLISQSLAALVEAGQVSPVGIEELDGGGFFALTEGIEAAARLPPAPERVTLLSPFDNLVIERKRIEWLFGFDYSLECYVPAAKRQYGYFVLPILWGQQLVGRLDAKADRKPQTLILRGLFFEPEFQDYEPFLPQFAEHLAAFARFSGCETVRLEQVSPDAITAPLQRQIEAAGLEVTTFQEAG